MSEIGPGSVIESRYRIDEVERGGSGSVYRGVALRGGRRVDLVIVAPLAVQGLRRATLFAHPRLATLLEIIPRPAGYGMAVFEPVEGPTLEALLRDEPVLEADRAVAVAITIADVLAALHQRGAAHGLVHPRSIVVPSGNERESSLIFAPSASPPNPYHCPERGLGASSPADDVWALAATLHTMLVGRPPPVAGYSSRSGVASAGVAEPALVGLLANCLARLPEQRVNMAAPVREALAMFRPATVSLAGAPRAGPWAAADEDEVETRALPPSSADRSPVSERPPVSSGPRREVGVEVVGATATALPSPTAQTPSALGPRSPRAARRTILVTVLVLLVGLAIMAARGLGRSGWQGLAGRKGLVTSPPAMGPSATVGLASATAEAAREGSGVTAHEVAETTLDLTGGSPVAMHRLPSDDEISACVVRNSPPGAFAEVPKVTWLCEITDPRTGHNRMKGVMVRGAKGSLTTAMSIWSRLRWFGMGAFALLRGTCCGDTAPLELPPTTGCDDTADTLNELVRTAAAHRDLAAAVTRYTKSVTCQSNAGRSVYFGREGSMGGGEEEAFRVFLSFLVAEPSDAVSADSR
ncbi:MAG: hypothetical protein JW751_17020 [Polyangiaceae bacterium]|nr:hypothetical protein [Polyangiaceae bacterium]